MCPAYDEDCVMISKSKMFYDRGTAREILLQQVYCVHHDAGCTVTVKWSQLEGSDTKVSRHESTATQEHFEILVKHVEEMDLKRIQLETQLEAERDILASKAELEEDRRNVEATMARNENQVGNIEERVAQLEQYGQHATRGGLSDETLKEHEATVQQVGVHDIRLAEMDVRFQCLETANYEGVLIWKVADYDRRKQDAFNSRVMSLYSQPFYTSRFGYKMCARVYLNGDGMGKEMNIASGCPMFISHQELQNSRFLKEDTVYMKVVVDTTDLVPR
ncbi:hypothetical protein NP493_44g13017 [Ridgeia piscesae]|uniref:TRAF1-6 MATH domain-containing protein n=1 Tax=Ridgeia piscesae TaxID=27915 RepID=A0AAD9PC58_RIDPI|nr:hypothetical protein NP493_44g13017 [Ridgeia piscesae]